MIKHKVNPSYYQNIIENIPIVTYICGPGEPFSCKFISPQIEKLTGWSPEDWISIPGIWADCIHPEDHNRVMEALNQLTAERKAARFEYRMTTRNGRVIWVQDESKIFYPQNGQPEYLIGSLTDITSLKESEEYLYNKTYRDSLTGLLNRTFLVEQLAHVLNTLQDKKNGSSFGLLLFDLDRFNAINVGLGFQTGDLLLIKIAHYLKGLALPGTTIVRLGEEEFAILLEGQDARQEVIRLSDRILAELSNPFELENKKVFTTASLGVVIGSSSYRDPAQVIRDAGFALKRAKARGGACYEVFAPVLVNTVIDRHQLEDLLREALERDEFSLYFQPIVSLSDHRITGFEALIRWITPQYGMIFPSDFVPLAEESGLIHHIDQWVMHEACRQVKYWQDHCAQQDPFTISVNLSGSLLQKTDIVEMISGVLEQTGLPAASLNIELTEKVFVKTGQSIINILQAIGDLGVNLQVDDFGTGYSSLAYLQRFPINTIKIDRTYINRVDSENGGSEIVQALIVLAKELGIDTIAEGIETLDQLHWLKNNHCNYGQGYLLYRPMDAESTERLLSCLPKPVENFST